MLRDLIEFIIGNAEERGAQNSRKRDIAFVRCVKDVEIIPHIVDFLPLIETDATGGEVRHFRFKQRVFNVGEMRPAADEERDVAISNWAHQFSVVIPNQRTLCNQTFDAPRDELILVDRLLPFLAKNNFDLAFCFGCINCRFCWDKAALDEFLIRNLKFVLAAISHQIVKKEIDKSDDIA